MKRPLTGYDALACAILQQAAEDWHAMVLAGAACPTGATGYWPIKRPLGDGPVKLDVYRDMSHGQRGRFHCSVAGPGAVEELWHFITSDLCQQMCESVGISHSAMMRGLNVTPRHES